MALPGESSLEGERLLQCMRRVGVNDFLRELALSWRGAVCHTCHGKEINDFLRELALSWRGAVCHTCHGKATITSLYVPTVLMLYCLVLSLVSIL